MRNFPPKASILSFALYCSPFHRERDREYKIEQQSNLDVIVKLTIVSGPQNFSYFWEDVVTLAFMIADAIFSSSF